MAIPELSYLHRWFVYNDILLADNGPAHPYRISAGASIIIVSQIEDRRDKQHSPLFCIHINDGSSIGAQSIYPMKLLAIMAALQLASHIQTPTTEEIVTDLLGCCQIANSRKRRPQFTNNYIALMNPLHHYVNVFKGTLRWTPAHPDDCLNHVADRVAEGLTYSDIDCQYNLIQLHVEDITESLMVPNSWTLNMKDRTTTILAGLLQEVANWRLVTYMQR